MAEENRDQLSQNQQQTSSGMTENVAGALCYLVGFVTGIIFLLIEKENKFVRYHAFQSIFLWGSLFIVSMVIGVIPIIGWFFVLFLPIIGLVIWIFCMYKAYKHTQFEIPIIGKIAKDQVYK